ncbi:MAG: hypothetical protein Unbinned1068contig1001_13 [Prokaryotic dsDNA virus sp.]|nr:MAG: hypothetical protein Unbinned1068contig1001_13 [Prokaryotic dsDNA virus sp.]|tara:strand:- start:3063 stop:3830 length:768 start_codon:yes stop_codon:yes gene_type:complete
MLKPVDWKNSKKGNMLLVYGPPGAGKSTFAARMAKVAETVDKKKTVIFDFEVGIRNALSQSKCNTVDLYDLSDPVTGMGQSLAKAIREIRDDKDVALVVVDTLSEMCWSFLRSICGLKQATLPMYGERKRQLKEVLLELRNLTKTGKHVLVLTHETIGEVEGLPGYYAPECPKNDRADIVGQFDFVGRMKVATKEAGPIDKGDHLMDLTKDPQQVTKCRFMEDLAAGEALYELPGANFLPVRNMKDVQDFYNVLN